MVAVCTLAVILPLYSQAQPGDEISYDSVPILTESTAAAPAETSSANPWADYGAWTPPVVPTWTIDYRFRTLCSSATSYQFGTSDPPPAGWAPLSLLKFPLDSTWHGLRAGMEKPNWGVHFEWLMPQQGIAGNLTDYDWNPPNTNGSFTDLGFADQRWVEGQMLDLEGELKMLECQFGWGPPVEVWPVVGFRWQRFNIRCYDGVQVKADNVWLDPPYSMAGDIIAFKQQYYMYYVGGQLRTTLNCLKKLPPVNLTFQGDWGHAAAYNVDHHLVREGDRFTMETTHGDSWHVSLAAEAPISPHFSLGFQADYLEIHTRGKHHFVNVPRGTDETWDNGVSVSSHQTWLTAFIRLRI